MMEKINNKKLSNIANLMAYFVTPRHSVYFSSVELIFLLKDNKELKKKVLQALKIRFKKYHQPHNFSLFQVKVYQKLTSRVIHQIFEVFLVDVGIIFLKNKKFNFFRFKYVNRMLIC